MRRNLVFIMMVCVVCIKLVPAPLHRADFLWGFVAGILTLLFAGAGAALIHND